MDGGPRRLVHGVFGSLMRKGVKLPDPPSLPDAVGERWNKAWGEAVVQAAAHAIAAPPPLDVTQRDPDADWAKRLGGVSLAPGHVRLAMGSRIADLAGYAEGEWWIQDLSASLPARMIGKGKGRANRRPRVQITSRISRTI